MTVSRWIASQAFDAADDHALAEGGYDGDLPAAGKNVHRGQSELRNRPCGVLLETRRQPRYIPADDHDAGGQSRVLRSSGRSPRQRLPAPLMLGSPAWIWTTVPSGVTPGVLPLDDRGSIDRPVRHRSRSIVQAARERRRLVILTSHAGRRAWRLLPFWPYLYPSLMTRTLLVILNGVQKKNRYQIKLIS
jgi:hypothetical protein